MSADIDLVDEIFCHCGKGNYESLDMYMFVLRSLKNTGAHFEPKALLLTMHFRCVLTSRTPQSKVSSVVISIFTCLLDVWAF